MVQQTDSKFSEYVLANSETGFPKQDKKTALRDLQNENRNTLPKSDGKSSLSKVNEPATEAIKVSGIKRPQQTPANNSSHLVYVRRKTESEQHKNNACDKSNDQRKKLDEHDEKNHQPDVSSKTTPLVTLDSEKSNTKSDNPTGLSILNWDARFSRLQNFLKALDVSKQDDYRQMLRSLTSVGLSRVAVELEKRSIQLSFEEAREVQRAKLMDVLNKFPTNAEEQKSTK